MKICSARAEDIAAIVRLEREIAEAPHWGEEEYAAIVGPESRIVQRCLFGAWAGGELVGFAVGKVVAAEAELESVVVRTSARRLGVGRALCAAVLRWTRTQEAAEVHLEVRVSNRGAIALYNELGFVEVGKRCGYYSGPIEDAILMTLHQKQDG